MQLHEDIQKSILDGLRTGLPFRRMAELVGYSVEDIGTAMRDDPMFAIQVRQAQAHSEYHLLQRLQDSTQWQAWKFLLQSLYPTRYVSSRKKPGMLKPPKLESEETRLRRLNASQLATLLPIVEIMDGKREPIPDSRPRRDGEDAAGKDAD